MSKNHLLSYQTPLFHAGKSTANLFIPHVLCNCFPIFPLIQWWDGVILPAHWVNILLLEELRQKRCGWQCRRLTWSEGCPWAPSGWCRQDFSRFWWISRDEPSDSGWSAASIYFRSGWQWLPQGSPAIHLFISYGTSPIYYDDFEILLHSKLNVTFIF